MTLAARIKSLFSNLGFTVVSPVYAPMETKAPFLVYARVDKSQPETKTLDGVQGLLTAIFDFTVGAETYDQIEKFTRQMIEVSVKANYRDDVIEGVFFVSEADQEPIPDKNIYFRLLSLRFIYRESTP